MLKQAKNENTLHVTLKIKNESKAVQNKEIFIKHQKAKKKRKEKKKYK